MAEPETLPGRWLLECACLAETVSWEQSRLWSRLLCRPHFRHALPGLTGGSASRPSARSARLVRQPRMTLFSLDHRDGVDARC
ncbi:type II toxin-antitoxin system antitoxin MazE8 [Mycobacterium tuberculosis]